MRIQIATSDIVVLEAESGETADEYAVQELVRTALKGKGLEQWSSVEIEDYTYHNSQLIFAKPIKIYIPSFMARLAN